MISQDCTWLFLANKFKKSTFEFWTTIMEVRWSVKYALIKQDPNRLKEVLR